MGKTCVLFGAGAEEPLGMSGGKDFAKIVLGIDCNPLNEAIEKFYNQKLREIDNADWFPPYRKTSWDNHDLLKAAVRKNLLEESFDTKKDYDAEVERKIKQLEKKPLDADRIINHYTSYMGLIDESFHTLIFPKVLGRDKFWRVVSCYTRAYCYLIGQMLDKTDLCAEDYYEILSDPNHAIHIMDSFAHKQSSMNSYYKILSAFPNINVITTNYTNLCKYISKRTKEQIAYPHGSFGWFESAMQLTVFDAHDKNLPNDLLFPYIFIQSGIKPIVEVRQLREYSKVLSYLNEAEVLLIVGYRLNADDNHLNSIIRSFITSGKKIIYFDFDNVGDCCIKNRLRLSGTECSGFQYILIDKDSCYPMFKNTLKNLS